MIFSKYKEPLIVIALVSTLGGIGAWFEFSERQHSLDTIDRVQTQVIHHEIKVSDAQDFLSSRLAKNYEYEKTALSTFTTVLMVAARSGVAKQDEDAVRYVLFSKGEAAELMRPQTIKYLQKQGEKNTLKPEIALLLGAYLQQQGVPVSVVKPYYEAPWLNRHANAAIYLGKLYLDNDDIPNYYLWCARGHCLSLSQRYKTLDPALKAKLDTLIADPKVLQVPLATSVQAK